MRRRAIALKGIDPVYAIIAAISVASFVLLTILVVHGRTTNIDRALIVELRASASPALTAAMLAVTFTSGRLAVLAAIVFAFLLYRRDGWRTSWYYVAACATAQLLNLILKYDIFRTRPHGISPKLTRAGGPSYPSADVMMSVVVFGLGVLLLSRSIESRALRVTLRALTVCFIVAASFARVYLGAHWPTDVLGGIIAGVACAAIWCAHALSDKARAEVASSSLHISELDTNRT
jgi:undecaprenyl-diphosphatase